MDNGPLIWQRTLLRAEGTRRTKSPPGTPQSHEVEEERARLNATQSSAPPPRVPLDLRLTEEELRIRESRKALGRLTNLVSSVVNDESLKGTVDPMSSALRELNESLAVIANVDDDLMDGAEFNASAGRFNDNTRESSASAMPSVNSGASTIEDRAQYSAFLNEKKASLPPTESFLDMTRNDDEEQSFHSV